MGKLCIEYEREWQIYSKRIRTRRAKKKKKKRKKEDKRIEGE